MSAELRKEDLESLLNRGVFLKAIGNYGHAEMLVLHLYQGLEGGAWRSTLVD